MPKAAKNYTYESNYGYQKPYPATVTPLKPKTKKGKLQPTKTKKKIKKKIGFFSKILSVVFFILVGIYPIPYGFEMVAKPFLFGPRYKEVNVNKKDLLEPTVNYLYNDLFLNRRLLVPAKLKTPEMTPLYLTTDMFNLESKLLKLMNKYKVMRIEPAIFVWDYETGKYVDINGSEIYSAASIIKIPVLIRLFKSIEANQLTIYDEMFLTSYYKANGSGHLKYNQSGTKYSIDELAKIMIQESDNSATNMIISLIGGMPDINNGIRTWGIKNTRLNNWLPDLTGTNYTTAKDLATMLYNLDNPGFLNLNSREYIVDYMSHVENNRLIQAGLDERALFLHKTGDIGDMLGDAGIVFAPNGKKYIVVILANRPYNSSQGKMFIQEASTLIYDSVISGHI